MSCTQGMVKNPRRQMSHLFMFVCVLIILISTQKERNFPYLGLWKRKFISLKHAVAYKWKRKHYCYRCNVLQRGGKDPIRIRHELFTRIRKVQCAVAENMVSVYETVCWYADLISTYSYVNKINIDVNQWHLSNV